MDSILAFGAICFTFVWVLVIWIVLTLLLAKVDLDWFPGVRIIKRWRLKKAARSSLQDSEVIWGEKPHEWRIVDDVRAEFPDLDHLWIIEMQARFERKGCRFLADIENVTLSRQLPKMRTFIRTMISPDGYTSVGVYHFRMRGFKGWLVRFFGGATSSRILELESELNDGTYLVVTTAQQATLLHDPPHMTRCIAPPDAPPDQLLHWHQSWLGYLRETRGVEPVYMAGYDDVMAMQQRLQAKSAAYRRSVGYFTAADARQIALDERFARDGEELSRLMAQLNEKRNAAKQEQDNPQ